MPSQAMQDLLESLRERQKSSADLPQETLEEARAATRSRMQGPGQG